MKRIKSILFALFVLLPMLILTIAAVPFGFIAKTIIDGFFGGVELKQIIDDGVMKKKLKDQNFDDMIAELRRKTEAYEMEMARKSKPCSAHDRASQEQEEAEIEVNGNKHKL